MTYKEEKGNLFDLPNDYALCQCISADFGMGAGIAVEFNKRYNTKNIVKAAFQGWNALPEYCEHQAQYDRDGFCLLTAGNEPNGDNRDILLFVTKKYYWNKPTYKSITDALTHFKRSLATGTKGIKLGMPRIGCGLDRLDWDRVRGIIKDVFADTDIEIVVRYL